MDALDGLYAWQDGLQKPRRSHSFLMENEKISFTFLTKFSFNFTACDYAGEKLAWWLGITKPKFLYEIEEYNRMKQEEEERAANEDGVEEIRIGGDNKLIDSPVKPHQRDGETRMVLVNESSSSSAEPNANLKLFQSDN